MEVWRDRPGELELIERFQFDDYSNSKYFSITDDEKGVFTYIMDGEKLMKDGYLLKEGIAVRVQHNNNIVVTTYTLHEDMSTIHYTRTEQADEIIAVYGKTKHKLLHTVRPGAGYYSTEEKLCQELNRCLKEANISFDLVGEGVEKRLKLLQPPPNHRLELCNGLHYILGFRHTFLTKTLQVASFKMDLVRGAFAMFIYCDFVKYTRVGNTEAPLLRTAHLHNTVHGAVVNQTFNPAHYVQVCKTHINVIEVDIRTDSGVPFPLSRDGKLILTLHFKRVSVSI